MKSKSKKISILLVIGFALYFSTINTKYFSDAEITNSTNPKSSGFYTPAFIHIDDNWTATQAEDWCIGDGSWGNPYVIENVTIDASLSPTGSGILINNSKDDYFIIRNCTITPSAGSVAYPDQGGGIKIINCSIGVIYNNTCSNGGQWGVGIFLYNDVHNITIERNKVQMNTGWGILAGSSSYNITIKNNTVTQNYVHGICLNNGVYNTSIINNNVNDNGDYAIFLNENCDNNKVINNNGTETTEYWSQENGIRLNEDCDYNFIFNNTLNNNDRYGMSILNDCDNNTFLNNTACNLNGGTNQDRGIFITNNCNYNNITGNIVDYNEDYGILINYQCNYNNITRNTANNNKRYGIYLYQDCDWNNLSRNTVNDNTLIGLFLRDNCDNNTLRDNTINKNDLGIGLDESNYNNVSENTLKDNNYCIFETDCKGNLIINNDCSTPTVQTPIFINGTATGVGAHNWTWVQQQSWFGGGSGTIYSPYIIENLRISGFNIDAISGIKIVNSNVFFTIRGCDIYNSVSGISLKNVNNSQLIDNNCSNNNYGIYLEDNCFYNNITENTLNNNEKGIYLYTNCRNNRITNNTANGNYDGIYLEINCNYTTITENTLIDNEIGIYLTSCGYNNITGNTATGNTYNGIFLESLNDYNIIMGNIFDGNGQGIQIYEKSDFNTIVGNTANDNENYGIRIEDCIKNIIQGNMANNNTLYGIFIEESSYNNTISKNNACDNNEEGILVDDYCINNTISRNIVNNNYRGITIRSSSEYNIISGNTINYNEEGIFVTSDSHNNTISDNTINGIYRGLVFGDASQDNMISGNTIKNCTQEGIDFSEGCDNNMFTDNVIYNNTLGIDISDSDDNSFYRNFFVDNDKHVNDEGTNTLWNSTTIGNYWDNYTGEDRGDGIGDVPHNISLSPLIQDHLPICDDVLPMITINLPTPGIYGHMAPSFNVRITDVYLFEMWYTIDGGLNNYIFTDNGTINQDAWDAVTEGNVTLTFYASDKPMNSSSATVIIVKDYEAPTININSPSSGSAFAVTAPSFDVTITDDYLVSMWYTIDGGLHNYTFMTNTFINQTRWDVMDDGAITLDFYAIDDLGHIGSSGVIIIKDTVAPIIIITSPSEGDTFGSTPPLFNITIIENNLDAIWYSFDGGSTNYTIINNGTFNQAAWTALSQGEVTITFYANDLAGHETSEGVTVTKSVPGGLNPGVIITIVIVSIVGGVAVISIVYIFMKKRATP